MNHDGSVDTNCGACHSYGALDGMFAYTQEGR
jgi:hypothetical protein